MTAATVFDKFKISTVFPEAYTKQYTADLPEMKEMKLWENSSR
jgi:hypothetical protein